MIATFSDSLILGLVQGITEFLPISSSGHLVIFKQILSIPELPVTFDIVFHFATLLAVLTRFYKDIHVILNSFIHGLSSLFRGKSFRTIYDQDAAFRLLIFLLIGTVPAAVVGLIFKEAVIGLFASPAAVSIFLIITGLVLLSTWWIPRHYSEMTYGQAFLIGVAQACALLPGVSRSGTTIACALWLGIAPEKAARFSFLLAVPAIFGALLLQLFEVPFGELRQQAGLLLIGAAAAYASGLAAIIVLLRVIERGKFFWFGLYCVALGTLLFTFSG
ncbi:undecaprenyl-diphosphate phosphatase [candidate division KSB1 bacterium]